MPETNNIPVTHHVHDNVYTPEMMSPAAPGMNIVIGEVVADIPPVVLPPVPEKQATEREPVGNPDDATDSSESSARASEYPGPRAKMPLNQVWNAAMAEVMDEAAAFVPSQEPALSIPSRAEALAHLVAGSAAGREEAAQGKAAGEPITDVSEAGMRARVKRIMQRARAAFDAPIYGQQNDDLDRIADVSKEIATRTGRAAVKAGKLASEASLHIAVKSTVALNHAANSYKGEYQPGAARRRLIRCALGAVTVVSAGAALKYGFDFIPGNDTLDLVPRGPGGNSGQGVDGAGQAAREIHRITGGDTYSELVQDLHPNAGPAELRELTEQAMRDNGDTSQTAGALEIGRKIILRK